MLARGAAAILVMGRTDGNGKKNGKWLTAVRFLYREGTAERRCRGVPPQQRKPKNKNGANSHHTFICAPLFFLSISVITTMQHTNERRF